MADALKYVLFIVNNVCRGCGTEGLQEEAMPPLPPPPPPPNMFEDGTYVHILRTLATQGSLLNVKAKLKLIHYLISTKREAIILLFIIFNLYTKSQMLPSIL